MTRTYKHNVFYRLVYYIHVAITMPVAVVFLLHSEKIHPAYRLSLFKKFRLGFKMFLNNLRIPSGSTYRLHLAMALKILETPPKVYGDIVECGTAKGGSAANLSLVCRIVGRKLKIYDSFEGLPESKPGDRSAELYKKGENRGSMEEVKANVAKYGICPLV